jgi:PAS domain S-box-containing protein
MPHSPSETPSTPGEPSRAALLEEIARLSRLNARLELLIESANLAWWDQDIPARRVVRSRAWAEMLGYGEDEIGPDLTEWKDRIHPEDVRVMEEASARCRSGELPCYNLEHRLRAKSGEWIWIQNWGRIVERDAEGNPLRALGFHLDITARKRAELEREELIGRLEKALSDLKVLRGIIPICSCCKKIRDDRGAWRQVEAYLQEHSEAAFSHGLCPECVERSYQAFYDERD